MLRLHGENLTASLLAATFPSPDRVRVADASVPALLALPFVAAVAPDVPFCPGE